MASTVNSHKKKEEVLQQSLYKFYLFLTKNHASKNPRMEAITFLCICMSLATSGFIHLLRAEHAGRVYSSSHMKINCAATHLSPNVAAYTSEVTLLHQHRPAWAGQRNMNHCR